MEHSSPFRMEAAGSLTPELEGGPRSAPHRRDCDRKGREKAHEAGQAAQAAPALGPEETEREHG